MMKICSKCKQEKELSEFYAHKNTKDGYWNSCKSCASKQYKEWSNNNKEKKKLTAAKYRAENKDKIKESQKKCINKNPEKSKIDQKRRYLKYRERNADKLNQRSKNWKLNNIAKVKQTARNYQIKNAEYFRISTQNRRAKIKNNGGKLSNNILDVLHKNQNGRCNYCECNLNKSGCHLDHIMPIALGGTNTDDNVQLLCPTCNLKKSAKNPLHYLIEVAKCNRTQF